MVILQFTYQDFCGWLLESLPLNGYNIRQGVLVRSEF